MKKFLFSVADAYYYKSNSNDLIFQSKTLLDSSIDATIQNEDARAGKGNSLQFVYYHSAELSVTLTEQQFNMEMLAPSIGSYLINGDIIQTSEEVILGAGGTGTVKQIPVNSKYVNSTRVTGTIVTLDGSHDTIEFSGSNFTYASGVENEAVCVTYNVLSTTTQTIEVDSNMVPSVGRLVLKAQLGSSESGVADDSASVIGEIEIEIPALQLNPSGIGMQMSASGISQSQLTGRALEHTTAGGCTTSGVYASIKETIFGQEKYTNALALVAINSEIEMSALETAFVNLMVVAKSGAPFKPDMADVVFASSTPSVATVDAATGLVTGVSAGITTITATIDRQNGEDLVATALVTVSE